MVFETLRRILRAIPEAMPGKQRVARAALRPFRHIGPVLIPDRYGNLLSSPSVDEPIGAALFASGVYEPDTLRLILDWLSPRGVYVDVGANIGAIALPIAAQRPHSRIVCVEADPAIAKILRFNVQQNARWNVVVKECLAGPGFDPAVPFFRAPENKFGMGSIGPQFGDATICLPQRRLDDILDECDVEEIDVVKIDIEGAEVGALKGLQRRLGGHRKPVIIFEFADWAESRIAQQEPGDAQRFLAELGYRVFEVHRGSLQPRVAVRTAGAAMLLAIPPERAP